MDRQRLFLHGLGNRPHFTALPAALTACVDANKPGKAQGSREQEYPSTACTGLVRPASVPLLFITQARSTSDSYLFSGRASVSFHTGAACMNEENWNIEQTTPTIFLTTDCWNPSSCLHLSAVSCSKGPSRAVDERILHFLEIRHAVFLASYFSFPSTYT